MCGTNEREGEFEGGMAGGKEDVSEGGREGRGGREKGRGREEGRKRRMEAQ